MHEATAQASYLLFTWKNRVKYVKYILYEDVLCGQAGGECAFRQIDGD